jgi:arylsulfatase A-like enzyme
MTGAPSKRPNVLILMADQLRADLVGANGSPICRTPNLDRLAREGVSYSRAYCVTPLCTPARAALFSGRYPHSNGLWANTQYPDTPTPRLRDSERLLFEHLAAACGPSASHPPTASDPTVRLSRAGYRCGYVGKWHIGFAEPGDENLDSAAGAGSAGRLDEAGEATKHGIHNFFDGATARRLHYERLGLPPRSDVGGAAQRTMRGDHPPMCGVTPYPEEYHGDVAIAAQASHLLRSYREQGLGTSERPFALVCSFHGPHFPIEVPEEYASLYDPADVPRPASFDDTFEGKPQGQRSHPWLQLAAHLSWPEWQRVIAHYWGFVSFIDALMGRVLATLEDAGLAEHTIVLATADHGEMAGHHRMFDKGPYFYEDVLRVPLIWRVPGHAPGHLGQAAPPAGTDPSLVSHVDVVPTLLALTGVAQIEGSPPLQGRNLLDGPRDAIFAEATPGDKPNPQGHVRAIVTDRWKYVFRPEDDIRHELYDLTADPDELHNLAADTSHTSTLRTLQQRLALRMRDTQDPLSPPIESLTHA